MEIIKVPGKINKHRVLVYAINTCAWYKRIKKFLKDTQIEYEYVDIDLCNRGDREKIREDILSRGGRLSYPTVIVDDKVLITARAQSFLKLD